MYFIYSHVQMTSFFFLEWIYCGAQGNFGTKKLNHNKKINQNYKEQLILSDDVFFFEGTEL